MLRKYRFHRPLVLGLSAVLATYVSARLATAMDAQLLRRAGFLWLTGAAGLQA